jgi:AcrR family transcriptional regulator
MTPPAKTPASDEPLTRERILDAAEDVLRRYGPQKTTVVDVARHLGVSHGSVYRHFPSKAALRDAVAQRFLCAVNDALNPILAATDPAPERLRRWITTLVAIKRAARASADRELFETYRALAEEAREVIAEHVQHLADDLGRIIAEGIAEGSFRPMDARAAGRAVLEATGHYHNPAHHPDWNDPATEPAFHALLDLLLAGLAASSAPASG